MKENSFFHSDLKIVLVVVVAASLERFTFFFRPRNFEIIGWYPAGPVLPHGKKMPL